MNLTIILTDLIQQSPPVARVLLPDDSKEFYQEDWFNALIGVVVGFLLSELANYLRRIRSKKEDLKNKLLLYYVESSSLINTLKSTALEAMKTNAVAQFAGVVFSAPPDIDTIRLNVIPTKTEWERNLIIYLKNVKHFQGLIDESDEFKTLVEKLNSFSVDLKTRISYENIQQLSTIEGTAFFESEELLNNILHPISNYMDTYISSIK